MEYHKVCLKVTTNLRLEERTIPPVLFLSHLDDMFLESKVDVVQDRFMVKSVNDNFYFRFFKGQATVLV